MLRKTCLFWTAAALFAGCDFFTTRELRAKPPEIRSLAGLLAKGDSLSFRVTESLWKRGARSPERILSRRRLVFTSLGDSLDGSDTLKVLSLRILDDSSGSLVEKSVRIVRFNGDGAILEGQSSGGGARFFPLKASADSGVSSDSSEAAFTALPALFVQGWSRSQALGVLEIRRELSQLDTLPYEGHLEETWGIQETVLDSGTVLARGFFRYGVSGLLKADQTWPSFLWRDDNGAESAKVELRRSLERL